MYFVLLAMFVVGKEWEAKIYSEIFVLKHASFWFDCIDLFVRIPKRFDFIFYDFLVIYYAISKLIDAQVDKGNQLQAEFGPLRPTERLAGRPM